MGICSPCCAQSDNDEVGVHKKSFVEMMQSNPFTKLKSNETNYVYDHCGHNMMDMYQSKVFGGCVFNRMGMKNGSYISNNLKNKILDYRIEYLYGGGYYKLENLPDPENN